MRKIVVDELNRAELGKISAYLADTCQPGGVEGIHWLELPGDLSGEAQLGHGDCAPFFFAVELTEDGVSFELLVRSRRIIRCDCVSYATPRQREYLLHFVDTMLAQLQLRP
ncbi:MAG: hypothetical protein AB1568_06740 [Thermodesulfobacteriota bacterium]